MKMASTATRSPSYPAPTGTFCYRIKRWRSYLGVTQRHFAELWGVSASLVQKIESNDYSVSQLSFERLEALRTLLQLPSSTFYTLIATHPDEPAAETAEHDTVQVERLETGLPPVSLPRTLLADVAEAQLGVFTVAPTDLADEGLGHRPTIGALVVFDRARAPRVGDTCAALTRHAERTCRVVLSPNADKPVLRPFEPGGAVLGPFPGRLELLGVVVAYWVRVI